MNKIFCNLILIIFVVTVSTAFAQKAEKTPRKEALTVEGSKNINQPPPPAPLIYKAPEMKDLKDFVSGDKTFQATFPGDALQTSQKVDNAFLISYRVYRKGSNSIVSTLDFSMDLEPNRKVIYENIRNSFVKLPKTTIVAEKDFQIGDRTGKEFDLLEDFHYQKVRILVVGARLYEIKSDVTNWHIIGEATKKQFFVETERFFNSFKHLKAPEKVVLPAPEGFLGEVKDATYKNNFFNFSFVFPNDWHRLDDAEIKVARTAGINYLKSLQEKTNNIFNEAFEKEALIFALAKGKIGSTSNLAIGVLKQPNDLSDAQSIAEITKNFFLTNPDIKLVNDIQKTELNGAQFSTFTLIMTANNKTVHQKMFITLRNGYSVTFALTALNLSDLKLLENIFESLKFNAK